MEQIGDGVSSESKYPETQPVEETDDVHPWAEKAVLAVEEILSIIETGDGEVLTQEQALLCKVWEIYVQGFTSGREVGVRSLMERLSNRSHHGLQGCANRNGSQK